MVKEPHRHKGSLVSPDQVTGNGHEPPFSDEFEGLQSPEGRTLLGRGHMDLDSSRNKGLSLITSHLLCFFFAHEKEEPEPKFLKGTDRNLVASQMGGKDNSAGAPPSRLDQFLPALRGCGHLLIRVHLYPIRIGPCKGVKLAPSAVEIVPGPVIWKDGLIEPDT